MQSTIIINTEYEKLIPPLPDKDYQELKESLKNDGQYFPITINEKGEILDGHHRYKICQELGIKARTEIKKFDNLIEEKRFVIKSNFTRRQLEIHERARLALELKKLDEQEREYSKILEYSQPKDKRDRKNRKQVRKKIDSNALRRYKQKTPIVKAAKQQYLSDETLRKYEYVINKSKPELVHELKQGYKKIDEAYKLQKKLEAKEKILQDKPVIELPQNCDLRCGDFREVLNDIPDNSIDLIFTDPPYDRESLPLYKDLGMLAQRVLKPGASLIAYCGKYAFLEITDYLRETGLNWHWGITVNHTGKHSQMFQRRVIVKGKWLVWFIKGDKIMDGIDSVEDVIDSEPPDKTTHEWAQSPVEAEHVISRLTISENQIVLDPFIGDGNTGIAAMKLKRKFIGSEIDKTRFDNGYRNIQRWI